jgi:hypothetical protein
MNVWLSGDVYIYRNYPTTRLGYGDRLVQLLNIKLKILSSIVHRLAFFSQIETAIGLKAHVSRSRVPLTCSA